MFHGKRKLTSRGAKGLVHVNRGIFQGDSLSPLIFVICMIALSLLLRKVKASYEWGRQEFKLNHLLFMEDLKLFRKSVNQIDGVFKFDGIHLPNQEIMEEIDENGYTYLENLELDEIKEHEMKIKATAEYKRRLRLILKSKLNGKNKNQAINTWAVALLKYGAGIINWIS